MKLQNPSQELTPRRVEPLKLNSVIEAKCMFPNIAKGTRLSDE